MGPGDCNSFADRACNPELRLDVIGLLIQKTSRQLRDQRNWQVVDQQLREAEILLPKAVASLTLLRVEMLTAQDRVEDAQTLLSSAETTEPRNLRYRLVHSKLAQRRGQSAAALSILDRAEKDLGPSSEILMARLDYWASVGGDAAKRAVTTLADSRRQIPDADRPSYLERLATVEARLGNLKLARDYWSELAALQPENVRVLLGLFSLAMEAADHADAAKLSAQSAEWRDKMGLSGGSPRRRF